MGIIAKPDSASAVDVGPGSGPRVALRDPILRPGRSHPTRFSRLGNGGQASDSTPRIPLSRASPSLPSRATKMRSPREPYRRRLTSTIQSASFRR